MTKHALQQFILAILTVGGWFALIAQFILFIHNRNVPVQEVIIRYFSYFTILSNILVAVCSTSIWLLPQQKTGTWFSRPQVVTPLAVYIIIVSLVYNIVLRSLWHPQGLQKIVDELLHTVIPVLFVLYWFYCVPKSSLKFSNIWYWTLFPLGYIIYILIRGSFSGFYPYPFLEVDKLGWPATLISIGVLTGVFILFFLLLLGVAKLQTKRGKKSTFS